MLNCKPSQLVAISGDTLFVEGYDKQQNELYRNLLHYAAENGDEWDIDIPYANYHEFCYKKGWDTWYGRLNQRYQAMTILKKGKSGMGTGATPIAERVYELDNETLQALRDDERIQARIEEGLAYLPPDKFLISK